MTHTSRQRIRYIVSDYLAGNVAWCLFNLIRYYTLPSNYSSWSLESYLLSTVVVSGQFLFPLLMTGLYALSGYYNQVFRKSRVSNFINTYGVALLGALAIYFIALFNDAIDDRLKNYEMVAILWMLIGTCAFIPRVLITRHAYRMIASRKVSFSTLIVGTGAKAEKLERELMSKCSTMGFDVVGYIDDGISGTVPGHIGGLPVVPIDRLEEYMSSHNVDSFIIAGENPDMHRTVATINKLFPTDKSIYITPDLMSLVAMRPRTQTVLGEVLIDVSKAHIPESTRNVKRVSDIIVSAITLVAISPVLAAIALIVKRSSPGPVIYKQQRIGYKKRPFNIYKFRSMYVGSENTGPCLSSEGDPRITPFGRVMRKYRLDELPQFWNVLKGDMSIVGPRPEREYYLRQIIGRVPYFNLLHQVRPGITSWGMVKYGYATSVDEMVERAQFDLLYIDNVSLSVDLKILFYTIETIIKGKGL